MPWATADHDLEATTGYLAALRSEWDKGENFNYAMHTSQGDVVGACGLMSRRDRTCTRSATGFTVRTPATAATAATLALAEVGLGQPGIDRVEICHDVDNPASGRLAAKVGFREVGSMR